MTPNHNDRLSQFVRSTSFLQLVRSELARIFSRPFNVIALIALMSVPLLYAGVYLWANKDPQGNLETVPAALVVEDDGAMVDGKLQNFGDEVADELVKDGRIGWQLVDEQTAKSGVESGEFYFAVTFPDEFSENLTSAVSETPTSAAFEVTTNDANNYLGTTIAEAVADELVSKISSKIGEEAAGKLLFGLNSAHDGFARGASAVNQLAEKLSQASDAADKLAEGANKLHDEGTQRLRESTAQMPDQANQLNSGAHKLADASQQASTGASDLASGAQELNNGLGELNDKVAELPNKAQQLADGAKQVADGNAQIAEIGDRIRDDFTVLEGVKDEIRQDARQRLIDRGYTEAEIDAIVAEVDAALDGGLIDRVDDVKHRVGEKLDQLDQLADGSQRLADGAAQLADASGLLKDAVGKASDGASRLSQGSNKLADGIDQIADGSGQLADGTQQLADAAPQLVDGVSQLDDSAELLASKLDEFAGKLPQAVDGANQIRDKLSEGAQKLPAAGESLRDRQAQTLGNPVAMSKDAFTTAAGYGEGLAPFFVSLAAWLGVFTIFLIVNPFSKRAVTAMRNPLPVAFAGWLVPALIGFIEMTLLTWLLHGPVGLHMERPGLVWMVLVVSSISFAALFQALRTWLDSTGQFIGLLLLVVQVTGAGGTFPVESMPPVVAAVHQYLPMSWTITALRQTMYGGDMQIMWHQIGLLLTLLGASLLVTWLGIAKKSTSRSMRDLRAPVIH